MCAAQIQCHLIQVAKLTEMIFVIPTAFLGSDLPAQVEIVH